MSKKKRILTWTYNRQRGNGRWRKQIDGKVKYFGNADSPEDTKAYRAAERRYFEFMQKREATQPITVCCSRATVSDVCEKFLQQLHDRYERGEISASYLEKTRCCLNDFASRAGPLRGFSRVCELDLADYRNETVSLPFSGKTGRQISPSTAKGRLATVRTLYRWAWTMRIIEALPRNLADLAKISVPKKDIQTFSLEELRRLWQAASPRLRCWMAIALNCGYGQQDISDLRADDIDWGNGYVERARSKTGIRAKHTLWDRTLELIHTHRAATAKGHDRLFLTRNGNPLVWRTVVNGELHMSDSIRCMLWQLQQKLGINDGRSFYSLRKTGATLIEQIDPAVTEMYLAHAEPGTKAAYAQRDWARLEKALYLLEGKLQLPY